MRLRQVERSERTRAALLDGAEAVFARNGFDAARIEDIAAEAGRTRGAFYANFANKSEVFLALRSRGFRRRAAQVGALLEGVEGGAARAAALGQYLLEQVRDSQGLMLQLEFKLYAVRHPEMRRELAERHLEAGLRVNREELPELFDKRGDDAVERRKALAVESLLEGFAVNAVFSPEVLDEAALAETVPALAATLLLQIYGEDVR